MRSPLILSVVLAACASANAGAPASETIRIRTPNGNVASATTSGTEGITTRKIAGPPDQVWRLLPFALDSLGIPVNTLDAPKRTIGNAGFNARGRLKNVPLSRYIDCGSSTGIGPNADSYQVNMAFMVELRPDGNASVLNIALQAMAKPVNFAQDYSACGTKGVLEARLAEIISARLPR